MINSRYETLFPPYFDRRVSEMGLPAAFATLDGHDVPATILAGRVYCSGSDVGAPWIDVVVGGVSWRIEGPYRVRRIGCRPHPHRDAALATI